MIQNNNIRPEYTDVRYGISSASITTAGVIIVASTGAAYHGISFLCSTTNDVTIIVYDSPTNTTGNILDVILITSGSDKNKEKTIPIMARYGITIGVNGTGGKGVVFYGPRG